MAVKQQKSSKSAKKPATKSAAKKPVAKPVVSKKSISKKDGLTGREDRFVHNYITNGGNGAKAARDAGYSKKTAREIACQNLTKLNIQEAIKNRTKRALEASGVREEEVVGNLVMIMRGHIRDVFDERGRLNLDVAEQNGAGGFIKSISYNKYGGLARVETYSRLDAIKQICYTMGFNKEAARNPEDQKFLLDTLVAEIQDRARNAGKPEPTRLDCLQEIVKFPRVFENVIDLATNELASEQVQ